LTVLWLTTTLTDHPCLFAVRCVACHRRQVVAGRGGATNQLLAIRSATGEQVFNLSSSIDWISWAVEDATGDIVGLGSCLCVASAAVPACPAVCQLGALLFLRWDVAAAVQVQNEQVFNLSTAETVPPPAVTNAVQIVDIGGGGGYKPRLVASGGALIQSTGVYSQLIMKRP
jgi:hypothetical protein